MMGVGQWLTEKFIYDPQTGRNLSNGTWVSVCNRWSSDSLLKPVVILEHGKGAKYVWHYCSWFFWLCQDQRVQWWRKSSVRHKQISGVRYYIRAINLGGLWNHIFQPICTVFLQLFGQQTPINSVNSRWSWWIDWPEEIDSGNAKHEVKEWQSSLKFMVCETRWTVFFRTLHLNLKLSAPPRFRLPIVIA